MRLVFKQCEPPKQSQNRFFIKKYKEGYKVTYKPSKKVIVLETLRLNNFIHPNGYCKSNFWDITVTLLSPFSRGLKSFTGKSYSCGMEKL